MEIIRQPAVPGNTVIDPATWTGTEMAAREDWIYRLSTQEIADIVAMAKSAAANLGDDTNRLLRTSTEDFALGTFAPTLAAIRHDLKDGRGFAVIRALPVAALTRLELAAAFWGIGRHLGTAVCNNAEGDMMGHVVDAGRDFADPKTRGYQTNIEMDFHMDPCDAVALLCVQTAVSGGESKVASSLAAYNAMVARRPDLAELLCGSFCHSRHGEIGPGQKPWYEAPVFNFDAGYLSVSVGPSHIRKGHDLPETPDLTAKQLEAIDYLEALSEELHFKMSFEPGDIQILNNYVCLHTRTGFTDGPRPETRRHLWRLWFNLPDLRPRTPFFDNWKDGVWAPADAKRLQLDYRVE